MSDNKTLEKVARAICQKRCLRAEVFNDPCIDPVTRANGPCQATWAQLLLSHYAGAAQAAIDAHIAALSEEGRVFRKEIVSVSV